MGLPRRIVVAFSPDIEPAAASNTASGIPLASSQMSITLSACTPCRASGVSALEVRQLMNASEGAAFRLTRSLLISNSSCMTAGHSPIQRLSSAKSASNSCADVGAVTTIFTGYRWMRYQSMAQEAAVDLPVPWPLRMEILRSLLAIAFRNSVCH